MLTFKRDKPAVVVRSNVRDKIFMDGRTFGQAKVYCTVHGTDTTKYQWYCTSVTSF